MLRLINKMYGQCPMVRESYSMWFIPMITMIFVMFAVVNYGLIEEPEPRIIRCEKLMDDNRLFKNFVAPMEGTLRLTKGIATQVHHLVKSDSIIVLSRKSIDGKAGLHLVVSEILPNEKFSIEAVDENGNVVKDDCGEIYFIIK